MSTIIKEHLNKTDEEEVIAANGNFTTYERKTNESTDEETEAEISELDENAKINNHDVATLKGRDKAADGPLEMSVRGRIKRAEDNCCWEVKKKGTCRHCPDKKKRKRRNSCCLLVGKEECRHRKGRNKNAIVKVSDKKALINDDKSNKNLSRHANKEQAAPNSTDKTDDGKMNESINEGFNKITKVRVYKRACKQTTNEECFRVETVFNSNNKKVEGNEKQFIINECIRLNLLNNVNKCKYCKNALLLNKESNDKEIKDMVNSDSGENKTCTEKKNINNNNGIINGKGNKNNNNNKHKEVKGKNDKTDKNNKRQTLKCVRSKCKTKSLIIRKKQPSGRDSEDGNNSSGSNNDKTGSISMIKNNNDELFSHAKTDTSNLSYLVCNIRGYTSKRASFTNILNSSEFDIVMVTETHLYGGKKPNHPAYTFVGRSREKINSKGGIAIGYKKELGKHMVKVAEGKGSNEYILMKCTAFKPNILLGVYYGNQEGTTPENVITENLVELFTEIDKYKDEGLKTIIAGDFNVHVGSYIPGNDEKTSKGGKKLIELCQDFGMEFMNKKSDPNDNHTHFDVTAKTSRILDLAISDMEQEHIMLEVDKDKMVTPYVIRFRNRQWVNNYTDHRSLIGEVKVERIKEKKLKTTMWRMNRPGGKEKYYEITDREAEKALAIIREDETTEIIYKKILKLIEKIKMEAYGKRSLTAKRREREEKEKLLLKRKFEIEENLDKMKKDNKRINEQIFMTRKNAGRNDEDEITEAIDHYKTGERLTDPDKIIESILDYNEEVLKKKEEVSDEIAKKRDERKEAINFFKLVEDGQTEEPLLWEDYMAVVRKVMTVNKGCYKDFTLAGPRWKTVMFELFQKIYITEQIPEDFKKTKLKKLYKKKGDKSKLTSYRFIHLRDWAGKMMEKLVLEKAEAMINRKIPDMQIGGQKKCNTVEHLMTVMAYANICDKERKALVVQLLDIVKCFDKVLLSDTLYDAAEAGVFGKRLRMIEKLHEDTKISLTNDPKGRERTIKNSTGQGTNWAPSGCSRSIAESTNRAVEETDNEMKVNGENRGTIIFVDDTARLASSAEMARDGGKIFTQALDELSLEAHPDKSRLVILGSKKIRDEMKEKLEKDPVMVQGWEMKTSESETYLGYQINEKGARESRNQSIEQRVRAARTKSIQLMKILEDEQMCEIGWIQSTKLLFTSIIISTLTYGSQTYVNMTKKQIGMLEGGMRECLYRMFELSKTAHYASVLFELNLIPIQAIIEQLKISWLNSLIHEKGFGTCLEVIKEEERKYPGTGIISEVRELCKKYQLPDVNETEVLKETIKERVWEKARIQLWDDMLTNYRAPYTNTYEKKGKDYWSLNKLDARLVLNYKIGELCFKDYKRREMTNRYGNTDCFVSGCREKDTMKHVLRCEGYETKIEKYPQDGRDFLLAPFLRALDMERWKKYNCSLIYRRDRIR